jgi:hypothetical protein
MAFDHKLPSELVLLKKNKCSYLAVNQGFIFLPLTSIATPTGLADEHLKGFVVKPTFG